MNTDALTAGISGRPTKAAMAEASRRKLLDAAVYVIRSKGYSAARVEDICAEAGLTKGAFFHHFASKETKARHAPDSPWTPESAALYSQAVLQGAFILAKAQHGPKVAADCLDHLTRYFETLLPIAGWNTRRPEALA